MSRHLRPVEEHEYAEIQRPIELKDRRFHEPNAFQVMVTFAVLAIIGTALIFGVAWIILSLERVIS